MDMHVACGVCAIRMTRVRMSDIVPCFIASSATETLGTHTISQRVLTEVEHIITDFRNTLLRRLDVATTPLEEQQRVIAWLVQLDCGMDPAWYYLKKQKVRDDASVMICHAHVCVHVLDSAMCDVMMSCSFTHVFVQEWICSMLDRAVDDMSDRMTSAYLRTRSSNGSMSGASRALSFGADEMRGSFNQLTQWNGEGERQGMNEAQSSWMHVSCGM